MPINFNCPHCGAKITAPTAYGGRAGKCNQCGKAVTIPEAAASDSTNPVGATGPATTVVSHTRPASPSAHPGTKTAEPSKGPPVMALAGVAVAVLVALVVWVLLRGNGGAAGPLDLAAQAPAESVAVAALGDPQNALKDVLASMEELSANNELAKAGWNQAKQESKDKLGFDVTDLNAYAGAGFDATKPLTLALLEIKQGREPSGAVIGIGVSNAETALATLKTAASKMNAALSEDTSGTPTVFASKELAAVVQEGRLYLAAGPPSANKAELLRGFLLPKSKGMLKDASNYRAAVRPLGAQSGLSGYLDLKAIASTLAADEKLALEEWSGLAFTTQDSGATGNLLFSEQSGIKKHLQPGTACRDFLSKMEKPIAVLTFSLADPVELLKYSLEKGKALSAVGRFDSECQAALGMDLNALSKLLKDGTGGIAIYPAEGLIPVGALAFIKTTNAEEAGKALQKVLSQNPAKIEKKTFGDNFVYHIPGFIPVSAGIVNGYVVVGNTKDRIEALAKGGGSGWQPKYGGTELLSLELFLGEAAKHFLVKAPAESKKLIKQYADENTYVCLSFTNKGEGLQFASETSGQAKLAAGAAIAAAIAAPNLSRSRSNANESAAIAGCKAYMEAQDIYRRTDWDGDGLLEYAQSLKGDFSLLEKSAGKGDLNLIDQAMANAEGLPSQGAIPKAGYCFKILKGQGPKAPGGRRSYVTSTPGKTGNNMTIGYALVAFPAQYGQSGQQSYVINNTGTVYQKDLGAQTLSAVAGMTEYDPGNDWLVAE